MAKITKEIIIKDALLAKLSNNQLTDLEIEKFISELGSIIEHVEDMNNVDISGLQPTDGWRTNKIEDLRNDESEANHSSYSRIRLNIINNFPMKKGDLLQLKGIFNES